MNSELISQSVGGHITSNDLMGSMQIPVIVSKHGSRLTYQMNLMFRQITNLFDHTDAKPGTKAGAATRDMDINSLRNRYLRPEKVKELVEYILHNLDSYLLPPISAVADKPFSFYPYNCDEIKSRMGDEYDLVKHPELTEEVLEEFDGMLQGLLIFKESEFNVEILDGNHRAACIHTLTTMGKEFKNLRIGIQIFVESDTDSQRQAFVDMNTSTPIDKTILTLFSNRDPLAIAAKQTIGTNADYVINELLHNSPDYIGFDAINDSVTRNSTAVLSLNMVKNMLIRFALGETGTPKKFQTTYSDPKSSEYHTLLKDFAIYMRAIFNNVAPYLQIKAAGTSVIPNLREEFISLTGAGLYLISSIGYITRSKNKNLESVAKEIAKLDWRREVLNANGTKIVNELFRTGILSETGNISNNRNALKASLDTLCEKLYL